MRRTIDQTKTSWIKSDPEQRKQIEATCKLAVEGIEQEMRSLGCR